MFINSCSVGSFYRSDLDFQPIERIVFLYLILSIRQSYMGEGVSYFSNFEFRDDIDFTGDLNNVRLVLFLK